MTEDKLTDEEAAAGRVGRSRLWLEREPDELPVLFHPSYDISFGGLERCHPFDAGKWGKIHRFLKEDGFIMRTRRSMEPREATKDDLLVVHSKKYLNSLKWSANVAMIMEVPPVACLPNCVVQWKALKPFRLHVGGTIAGGRLALKTGWAINLGGGFHHCSASRGGGFCAYADITLTIRFLLIQRLISRALIIDLDAHQGNGHERDFVDTDEVYIMDMFNEFIYPFDNKAKAGINLSVPLRHHTKTPTYLQLLRDALPQAFQEGKPDLVVYNAGTDCLEGDPLGNLDVSPQGIIDRDEMVFQAAREHKVPILMVTSGGYQRNNARIIADSILNLRSKACLQLD